MTCLSWSMSGDMKAYLPLKNILKSLCSLVFSLDLGEFLQSPLG